MVPQQNVNTLYTQNKFDIRQEVWAISVLVALTRREQPTAASKHDTERRHKGSTREPQETGSKGTNPPQS